MVDIDAIDREIARRRTILNLDIKAGKLGAREMYTITVDHLLDARLEAMKAERSGTHA